MNNTIAQNKNKNENENENETLSSFDKYIAPVKNSVQKGFYDFKDGTFTDKLKNGIIRNILIISVIILLIMFTIFTNEFNKLNYYGLTNFNKEFALSSILVGFFALLLSTIYLFKYKFQTDNPDIKEEYTFLKTNMKNPLFIVISFYITILLFRYGNQLMNNYKTASSIVVTFLLFSMILGFVALFIYYLNIYKDAGLNSENDYQEPDPDEGWIRFFSRNVLNILNLLKNIIIYIPCLLIDISKFIHNEYKMTPSPAYVILLLEIIIVIIFFALPYITKFILTFLTHDSKDLIEDPINLDRETQMGTFQDINTYEETTEEDQFESGTSILVRDKEDIDKYSKAIIIFANNDGSYKVMYYKEDGSDGNEEDNIILGRMRLYKKSHPTNDFAISSWVFLNDQTGDDKYYNVFNYGDKPKISYNPKTNKLRFEVLAFDNSYTIPEGSQTAVIDNGYILNDKDKSEVTQIFEVESIPLQRWNHMVINFTGTHIDIFINNEISFTVNNVIPYLSNDPVYSGDQDGVYGGICNTQYFSRYLNKTSISLMYNSLQNINPPLL